MQDKTIAFIGAGNMGQSLIGGLIADGFDPKKIWASNHTPEKLTQLVTHFNIHTSADNNTAAEKADVIIFTVKPQILKTVTQELASVIQKRHPLVISIAAGVREKDIQRWLGGNSAIVRCMPNTPALIRCSATGLFANSLVNAEQKNLAESILRAVGLTLWLDKEEQLDIVTALSGNGPAYFFSVIEALEKTAVDLGISPETAHLLTLQTALGAARMALESEEPINVLRKKVTSPGGTTERALQILEAGGLDKLFAEALSAAKERSLELAKKFGE